MTTQYKTLDEIRAQFNAEYDAKEAEFERSGKYIVLALAIASTLLVIGLQALAIGLFN